MSTEDLQVLTRINEHQRKGNPKTFMGLDNGAELRLSQQRRRLRGHIVNDVLAQVHLTVNLMGL